MESPVRRIDLRDWARRARPFVERELSDADMRRLMTRELPPEGD